MQKYLIIVGKNPEMVVKVETAMKEAGFATNIPYTAKLISVNTYRDSHCDQDTDASSIYGYYQKFGVKLLWPEDVLDGKAFKLDGATPKVDECHPPKGYRLVTKTEIEYNFRPDDCKTWFAGRWVDVINNPRAWNIWRCIYAIPVNCVLKPKTVKMTMSEINKVLGKNIEVIEG